MLAKDDVDQMVRDAQEHAEEDKQRREEVETRNQAEALTFQAERTLKDLGDKVSSEDKADVESEGRGPARGPQGQRHGRGPTAMQQLAESLQRVGTAAYQAAGAAGASDGSTGGNGAGPADGAGEPPPRARRRSRASSRRSDHRAPAPAPTEIRHRHPVRVLPDGVALFHARIRAE